ncbi:MULTISPECIES: gephyrin-like molybdotransferase Glp [unclassified Mesorhizobium]|uniref:molybdopterin molybdotransferase MoeA n=1 Tax=unclassified Mesorhizobium TaxID=325217 RepID=UPI000FD26844|nr:MULTISPECIES: gephyrin-like molybdotransferase Glp [unclassified Mesorhizobium]AZV22068.1 molybdopterin molybdenumtransferase MoeA [Mesorhizobium sp. M7A.F.Ce.TU.012.03.2.1]RUU92358.1 molybdopterin molybdenumtransferase MoeA [Mesorhizobium sp. M7A.F.Ca.MR.176.00.0.0]RVD14694.1 molybdopterin molybdenumtransferase MoeA [Mesorhizobium sp. M7A.F.Ca.ET.027.02.1.1]RWB05595.1 MAG: molybdopterin molybdenumtransferase MoeA [Mesorhizobium sp.]RWB16569.1 MAG: molybdopterin molybdenumtransferase MoeA [
MALVPIAEALERLLDGAAPLAGESVPLFEAVDRVLAEPVVALRTQPPFNASAMDGYAARAADVTSVPSRLSVIGMAPAGRGFDGTVGQTQAVRIFTGAPLPEGADTIVIQENVRDLGGGEIEVTEPTAQWRNIRRIGLDFSTGDMLLEKGRLLDPAALSLAASANHPRVSVVKRPLVAIIATGDELLPPGSDLGPDQIISSNAYGVAATAHSVGARALDLGIAADRKDAIAELVQKAVAAGADVIVTLGGASVGDHDLIHDVLTGEGMTLGFWKIAMRPGKPLMFGRLGDIRCIGLPGNPVASLVCSQLFLKPLLARLGGRNHRQDIRPARLGAAMPANDLRQDYVRAVVREDDGVLVATPFGIQDSSMLRMLADANGLIVRAPFAPAAAAGEACSVLMLR